MQITKLSQKDLQSKSIVDKILSKLIAKKHLPIACFIFLEIRKHNYDFVLFSSLTEKIIEEYKKNNERFIKYGRYNNFYENDEQVKKAINITVTTTSAFHKVNKDKDNYMLKLNYSKALNYLKNVKNKEISSTVMQMLRNYGDGKGEKYKETEEKSEPENNETEDMNYNDVYSEGNKNENENINEKSNNDNENKSDKEKEKNKKEEKINDEKNKANKDNNSKEEIKNIIEKNKINIKIIDASKTEKDDKKINNDNKEGIIKVEPLKINKSPSQISNSSNQINNSQNNNAKFIKINNPNNQNKEKEKASTAIDFENEDEEMNFIENCFNLDEKARQKQQKKLEPDLNIEIPKNLSEHLSPEEIKKRQIQKYIFSLNNKVKDKKSAIDIPNRVNKIKEKMNKFNNLMSNMENDFKELSECISLKEKSNNENVTNNELIQDKYDKLSKEIKDNEEYLNICYSNMQLIYKILMNSNKYKDNFNENFIEKHQKLLKDYEKKYGEFLDKICEDFDKMKNLAKTKELRKIYQDIYEINNELNQNNFNYNILKNLQKKIDENVNEDKKVDSNIEIFKNNYLQKKTKLMDSIEDLLKEKDKEDEKDKNKEELNKENKQEIANESKA